MLLATGRRLPRSRAAYARVALIGVLTAVYQASYFAAVALTSVSLATLITIGSSPVLVLAVETITGRRRLDRAVRADPRARAGWAWPPGRRADGDLRHRRHCSPGRGSRCCPSVCFGTMSLACAAPVAGLDELTTTGVGFSIGGALLLAVTAPTVGVGFAPTPAALGLVAFLGLVPTAVAYVSYFRGLPDAGPGAAALLALLEPLVGSLLAALFLHQGLGVAGWCGAVLLMIAVGVAGRTVRR